MVFEHFQRQYYTTFSCVHAHLDKCMKFCRAKLGLELRCRFLFMSLRKCFPTSTIVLLVCPIMVPCSFYLSEYHWVVRCLRGTGSSARKSCSLLSLQMFLSLIAESVKVSVDKDAAQMCERRKVPHGPTVRQIKSFLIYEDQCPCVS